MRFLKLLAVYLPPYKGYLLLYILFTILTALFSVFSFSAVIPLLRILFGLSDTRFQYEEIAEGASWSDMMEAFENNLLFGIQEQMTNNGETWTLFLIGVFLVITSLLSNIFSYFASFFRVPIRTGVLRDIRREMYDRILYVSNGFLSKDNKGDAISRMTSDALEFEWCIADTLSMLVKDPIKIIIFLITLYSISWQLATVSVILLAICGIFIGLVGYPLKAIAHKGQKERGSILSTFDETLGNISLIKSFCKETSRAKSFDSQNHDNRRTFNLLNRVRALSTCISDFLVIVSITVLIWIEGSRILAGTSSIDATQFIYFLIVYYSILKPMGDLANSLYGIRKCMASVERVDKIMNLRPMVTNPSDPKPTPMSNENKPLFEFKGVSFSYPEQPTLFRNMSFSISKGDTIAIAGHTGCGKSTLANLLMRFYDVTQGQILYNGTDIRELRIEDLRNKIAYVSQETLLFNDTIYNNIAIGGVSPSRVDIEKASELAGIHDFILSLPEGYDTIVGDRGCSLSGGQKQCIALARAILKKADIIILDEASSALDAESEEHIQQVIDSIKSDKTFIIISHHVKQLLQADQIIVIDNGRVSEIGTPEELINANGYISKIYKLSTLQS